jgi:hypothetical protein
MLMKWTNFKPVGFGIFAAVSVNSANFRTMDNVQKIIFVLSSGL